MNINSFSVGPIVGGVTETSIRLWGRGLSHLKSRDSGSAIGVARLKKSRDFMYGPPCYFPLKPAQDYTGVIEFSDLEPGTDYDYEIGWLPSSMPPPHLDWVDHAHCATVTTASSDSTQPRTFIFGSCRYLLRIKPKIFFDRIGDRTFQQILQQSEPIHRFLMLGDQIYADDLRQLSPDQTLDNYNLRYRLAFSQPHIRALMATTPTAMMLDDHEIRDNWPAKDPYPQTKTPENILYKNAIQAFYNYQLSHSSVFSNIPLESQPRWHWYQFQDGCCDFFIADTRTERNLARGKIIGDRQMTAIKNWLTDGSDRVKILASSVLIFPDSGDFNPYSTTALPNSASLNPDQWCGFRAQQLELLDFIRLNHLSRVIFLSGDVHASFSARLAHPDNPNFQVLSIVSSPFFWPFFHSKAPKFQLEGRLGQSLYYIQDHSAVMSRDNFTQVNVTSNSVQVKVIPRHDRLRFWRKKAHIENTYFF